MKEDLKTLSREELENIILELEKTLSEKQKKKLKQMIQVCKYSENKEKTQPAQIRMSQELVDEKMQQIEQWKCEIDEGEVWPDIEEYEDYSSGYWNPDEKIEETGKKALEVLDVNLRIRGEIALKAAAASSVLKHEENMMKFCFECFRPDSKVKNYLRLFGTDKMAKCYVMQGT